MMNGSLQNLLTNLQTELTNELVDVLERVFVGVKESNHRECLIRHRNPTRERGTIVDEVQWLPRSFRPHFINVLPSLTLRVTIGQHLLKT